jgi:hypothetical protein
LCHNPGRVGYGTRTSRTTFVTGPAEMRAK